MSTRRSYIVTALGVLDVESAMAVLHAEAQAISTTLALAAQSAAQASMDAGIEQQTLAEARQLAEQALLHTRELGRDVPIAARLLGAAEAKGSLLSQEVEQAQGRLAELERQIAFVTRDAEMRAPAMMTVLAMEANGYRLQETISKEGIIAYFTSADASHEIAVRHRIQSRQADTGTRWEMEAETFHTEGDECLYLMEDFETACEEVSLASMTAVGPPKFPKRDGESAIPMPSQPLRRVEEVRRDQGRELA